MNDNSLLYYKHRSCSAILICKDKTSGPVMTMSLDMCCSFRFSVGVSVKIFSVYYRSIEKQLTID